MSKSYTLTSVFLAALAVGGCTTNPSEDNKAQYQALLYSDNDTAADKCVIGAVNQLATEAFSRKNFALGFGIGIMELEHTKQQCEAETDTKIYTTAPIQNVQIIF